MASGHDVVVYEVNLKIDKDILTEYQTWLIGHVKDMLKIEGFLQAEVSSLEDDQDGHAQLCAVYHLCSQKDLDNYLANHAAHMRDDGIKRFGQKFSATRRVRRILFSEAN